MATWECPYCSKLATSEAIKSMKQQFGFNGDTKHGPIYFQCFIAVCPNPECKEYIYSTQVNKGYVDGSYVYPTGEQVDQWMIRPQGTAKSFPDYIPKTILEDYKESALIKNLSPKASATLSRRCLQGMIRDFWNVKEKNLYEEIKAIENKVDSHTWYAIDAIRSIGNIGAHMEKDINFIIEVDSDEAGLLIDLIETLLKDWYVERENRRLRSQAIIDAANQKKALKKT